MQNKSTGSQTQTKLFPIKQELKMVVFFFSRQDNILYAPHHVLTHYV